MNSLFRILFAVGVLIVVIQPGKAQLEAVSNIDSLEALLPNLEGKEKVAVYTKLIAGYHGVDIKKALEYGKRAEPLVKTINDPYVTQELYRAVGACYYQLSEYDIALEYFLKSMDICKSTGNQIHLAGNYNNIAAIYYDMNQLDKSIDYFNKALEIFAGTDNHYNVAAVYSNLASVHLQLGESEKAKIYLTKSIKINQLHLKNVTKEIRDLTLLAQIHYSDSNTTEGISTCMTALEKSKSTSEVNLTVMSELREVLARLYMQQSDYKKAKQEVRLMIRDAHDSRSKNKLRTAYELLTETYVALGEMENAFEAQKNFVLYNDSVLNEVQLNRIYDLETKNEINNMEKEIALLQKDKQLMGEREKVTQQQRYLWIASLLAVALLLTVVLVFTRQQLRKSRMEEDVLSNKLQFAQQELTTFALTIVQKNEALDQLKKNMEVLNKVDQIEDRKKMVRSLIQELGITMGLEQDKILIKSKINDIEAEYLRQLEQRFPDITKNEKQLAVLLRSNFTSKEIASIFNISHHSVNVSRYRLRKKLGLEQGDDLVAFLNSI